MTAVLYGCSTDPPAYIPDAEEAVVYEHVVAELVSTLDVSTPVLIHPYLAVAADSSGSPTPDMSRFEYEPSTALEALEDMTDTIELCQVDTQGLCSGDYAVLSQITRISIRDAVVVVRSIKEAGSISQLVVMMRYSRGSWVIAGTEAMSIRP